MLGSGFRRGRRRRHRRAGLRVRRFSALLLLAGIMLMLATESADAQQTQLPALSVRSLAGFVTSLTAGPEHWNNVPRQATGTAAGLSHQTAASATRAHQGAGQAPGTGKGALPAYAPYARKAEPGLSHTVRGFSAKTSRRDAARSTATSDYYRNADGSVTQKITGSPVNYKDGSSGWQPINTAVSKRSDGRWAEKANSLSVNFAPSASAGNLVSFAADGSHAISYGLRGAAAVTGKASGSTVTYPGVEPATDLKVAPTPTGVKESIILHSAQAANSWVFPLDLKGLEPVPVKTGAIDLVNSAGKTVEEIPPAYAYDSKVNLKSGDPATTYNVRYTLETLSGKPALIMTLDPAWLHSPDRKFPVTVDPSVTYNDGWVTTYAESPYTGDHSAEQSIKIGSYDSGTHSANSFISHWFSSLDGSGVTINSAWLVLYDSWASICTPESFNVAPVTSSWTPSSVTSYPGPSYGASIGSATPNVPDACANTSSNRSVGDWVDVSLSTSTLQGWANGTTADHGLAVYAPTTDADHWKQFGSFNDPGYQPYMQITYTGEIAPQIYQQYPSGNAVTNTETPELSALGFTPNSADTLKYDFQIFSASGGSTPVVDSGLVGQNWTVPAGKLTWGETYYWTVRANDGTDYSAAPPWSSLSVQVKQPLITSGLSQNGSDHGFDPSIGNYTTSDTDASIPGAGPSLEVTRDYNSRDPRWTGAFGAGWSSVLDAKATEQVSASGTVTGVVVTYPDGSEVGYGKNSDGSFTPPEGRFATLRSVSGGGYTLTDKNDTVYTFGHSVAAATSTTGAVYGITSVADANGRALNFTWSGGQITTMTSAVSGRALHITWTPAGTAASHVSAITSDPVSGTDQTTALTWSYGYTGDQLTSVCQPGDTAPACTTYSYQSGSQYQNAVLDLDPQSYWPLSEASGTTAKSAVLANEGTDNATYANVTLGQPGPLAGSTVTAAGFNGTSSSVTLPDSLVNSTDSQTVSMWFKTSTAGGVLFSYNSQPVDQASLSGYYTPSIYVGTDGKLNAEFWYSAGIAPIVSKSAVDDGQWHHLVLSAAGSSQSLYFDGALQGSASGQVSDSTYVNAYDQNYTVVGAGYLGGGWPDEPNAGKSGNTGYASYFNGSIAGVSVYSRPLVQDDVTGLYRAGTHAASLLSAVTRPSGKAYAGVTYDPVSAAVTKVTDENGGAWTLSAPTVTGSSQVYRASVLGEAPKGYWRLGDTAGASVAADEVRGSPAAYNGVTLGSSGPFSDATAASFNGSSSYVQLPSGLVTGGTQSISLWFKTSTGGGVIYSSSASPITANTTSGNYASELYIGSGGDLNAEFWNGSANPMLSSGPVDDGKWHNVVLTGSSSGEVLYLDGQQEATLTAPPKAVDSGTDYDYLGAGFLGGSWPHNSHTSTTSNTGYATYFNGSIAEAAYYPAQLTADQVTAEWEAAHGSQGLSLVETVKVTDPGSKTLTYQYDPLNGYREIASIDGLGNKTTYGYDTSGFEHTVTDPDGDVTVTDHDPRGNTVSTTTCQNQAASTCSTEYFTYYPDDTSAQLTTADPRNDLPLTLRDGRSSSATDNTYLTSYGYDAHGNETTETTPPVPGFPNGRTATTTYSDGTSAYPAADSGNVPAGLPVKAVTPGGATSTISYLHNGDVASTTDAEGLVTKYTYDGVGRVLTKTVVSDTYPQGLVSSYSYDKNSNVVQETDPAVTDRVTGAKHTPATSTVYDADGNVTSQTVSDSTGGDSSRT